MGLYYFGRRDAGSREILGCCFLTMLMDNADSVRCRYGTVLL